MAKAHKAALTKPHEVTLSALPCGGFVAFEGRAHKDDYGIRSGQPLGAFSKLDEALDWLKVNMSQPAATTAT